MNGKRNPILRRILGKTLSWFRLEPVGVIIQASMVVGTVPGLLAQPVGGKPYLQHQLDRVLVAFSRPECVVVTTELAEDRSIVALCQNLGVPFYVGDRDDALRNCIRAAQGQGFRSVMILRSDSPLIDPVLMAQVKAKYLASGEVNQYVSNRLKRTYPEGMEVEMIGVELLSQAYLAANQWSDFKDPTRLLRRGDLSHCQTVDVVQAVDHSQWRFCLDTWADHQQLSTLLGLVQNYSLQELMTVAEAHGLLVQKSRTDEDPGGGPGLVKKRPPSIGR